MTNNEPGSNRQIILQEIKTCIESVAQDPLLYLEQNFSGRANAIDYLEFHIIGRIDITDIRSSRLVLLKKHAEKLKSELEGININLFNKLRSDILVGRNREKDFKNMVTSYIDFTTEGNNHDEAGYDNLDIFINGLLSPNYIPEQTKELEPEMVFYQKTPARIIFELVEQAYVTGDDIFFDLGSGLGQQAILVNLLTGAKAIGVEFEPAFCNYANDCAKELNLPGVTFINTDARQADYRDGTVFFMYTPFKGEILQDVLVLLRKESLARKITIITYGPCTAQVSTQDWLDIVISNDDNIYKIAVFTSF